MKHIKKFNESNSDYYFEISKNEYREIEVDPNNQVEFDSNEKELLSTMGYELFRNLRWYEEESMESEEAYLSKNHTRIEIKKIWDDWYVVSYWSLSNVLYKYYKCDQWEGLLKLLEVIDK